jgi:hypothetical protein
VKTYRVMRYARMRSTTIAQGIGSLAEAAEIALRLVRLQEQELGGDDEFYAEAE